MTKLTAAITAVGKYLPEYILTNKELETYVDTNDEWITTRTGIKERRILKDPEKATSDIGVEAINKLFEKKEQIKEYRDLFSLLSEPINRHVPSSHFFIKIEICS